MPAAGAEAEGRPDGVVKRAAAASAAPPPSTSTGDKTAVAPSSSSPSPPSAAPGHYKPNPFDDPWWLVHLFTGRTFTLHRVGGLAYLLMYASAWHAYLTDYDRFIASPLILALPLLGVAQAVSATLTIAKYLPKAVDPGYYSDASPLSAAFVAENIFFSSLLAWQWAYYSPTWFPRLADTPLEAFFVFLPYTVRPLFPKTSMRDSIRNNKNKTAKNYRFFVVGTWVTKVFYVIAKHGIGFLLNYLRFVSAVTPGHTREMYRLLLFSCFATTISMFLHTLKFKGFIGPRTSFGLYVASYMATFYSIIAMADLFVVSWRLVALAGVGMALNFAPVWVGHAWQVAVMGLLYASRHGLAGVPALV
jgi:hypothetical protein